MNNDQLTKVRDGKGFIAALDQSGGSTPKALKLYGLGSDAYASEEEMFERTDHDEARAWKPIHQLFCKTPPPVDLKPAAGDDGDRSGGR